MSDCKLLDIINEVDFKVMEGINGCVYHKKHKPIIFDKSKITPRALCPLAFKAVYHQCLAKLYFANNKNVLIPCPNNSARVCFEVKTRKIKSIFNFLKKILLSLGIPNDLKENEITIVVNNLNESCPFKYQVGDEFIFNLGDKVELCPASTYSFFPLLLSKDNKDLSVCCPSDKVSIYYKTGNYEEN